MLKNQKAYYVLTKKKKERSLIFLVLRWAVCDYCTEYSFQIYSTP